MSTLVAYADTTDGHVTSFASTYAAMRAGSGLVLNPFGTPYLPFGQANDGAYTGYESFLGFDTSSIGAGSVSAATLSLWRQGWQNGAYSTAEARVYDWGTSLTTDDWVPGASLGGCALVAHRPMTDFDQGTGYVDFVDDALPANVNKTGPTRLVLCCSDFRLGNAPSQSFTTFDYEGVASADTAGTTNDPKLTVTYTSNAGLPAAGRQLGRRMAMIIGG